MCNCVQQTSCGCPVQLDADCVMYHKENSEVNNLPALGVTNGATLTQILEVLDTYIAQLQVNKFKVPYLTGVRTINTLKQFVEAVDTELSGASTGVSGFLGERSSDPSSPLSGQYWYNTSEDAVKIQLAGSVRQFQLI